MFLLLIKCLSKSRQNVFANTVLPLPPGPVITARQLAYDLSIEENFEASSSCNELRLTISLGI